MFQAVSPLSLYVEYFNVVFCHHRQWHLSSPFLLTFRKTLMVKPDFVLKFFFNCSSKGLDFLNLTSQLGQAICHSFCMHYTVRKQGWVVKLSRGGGCYLGVIEVIYPLCFLTDSWRITWKHRWITGPHSHLSTTTPSRAKEDKITSDWLPCFILSVKKKTLWYFKVWRVSMNVIFFKFCICMQIFHIRKFYEIILISGCQHNLYLHMYLEMLYLLSKSRLMPSVKKMSAILDL